jgi:hypothetical protein
VAGLRGHATSPFDKITHASWPSIVGRSSEAKIAEFSAQFGEEFRCFGESRLRVEWIGQPALRGCIWHKLRNPLRPMTGAGRRPDRVGLKPALFPDYSGEELKWQSICCRCRLKYQTDRIGQAASFCRVAITYLRL